MEGGRLLHGTRGGAGELAFLDLVEGVGDTYGIASLARTWAAEALAGEPTALRAFGPGRADAGSVFAAAAAGGRRGAGHP